MLLRDWVFQLSSLLRRPELGLSQSYYTIVLYIDVKTFFHHSEPVKAVDLACGRRLVTRLSRGFLSLSLPERVSLCGYHCLGHWRYLVPKILSFGVRWQLLPQSTRDSIWFDQACRLLLQAFCRRTGST